MEQQILDVQSRLTKKLAQLRTKRENLIKCRKECLWQKLDKDGLGELLQQVDSEVLKKLLNQAATETATH